MILRSQKSKKRRLLVVEDDEMVRESLVESLNEMGIQTDGLPHYKQVNKALVTRHYDAILLDHYLPWKTGSEITNTLLNSSKKQNVRIILMSANRHIQEIADELHVDFIEKPFSAEDLITLLKN